jgi:hypothetical protein
VIELAGLALFYVGARRQRPALLQQILRLVVQDVVVAHIFLFASVAILDIDVSCVGAIGGVSGCGAVAPTGLLVFYSEAGHYRGAPKAPSEAHHSEHEAHHSSVIECA